MTRLSNILVKVFVSLFGFFTCVTIFASLTNYVSGSTYFTVGENTGWLSTIIGICAILMVFLILALFRLIDRLSKAGLRNITIILMALYGLELLFVHFSFVTIPITDSFYVHDQAIAMVQGKADIIDGSQGYFSVYSNNNGIVILMYFLYSVANFFGFSDFLQVLFCI